MLSETVTGHGSGSQMLKAGFCEVLQPALSNMRLCSSQLTPSLFPLLGNIDTNLCCERCIFLSDVTGKQ